MEIDNRFIENLIFKQFEKSIRFTQDSPVYPDVWLEYFTHAADIDYRADLILLPHRKSSAATLFKLLSERLSKIKSRSKDKSWQMASTGESVVARLTLDELITVALPMTNWWQHYLWHKDGKPTEDQNWLKILVGALIYTRDKSDTEKLTELSSEKMLVFFQDIYNKYYAQVKNSNKEIPIVLWSISRNRVAGITINKSVPTTKADAGRRVFDIDGSEITWAILDTGIDARHLAFRKINSDSKIPFPKPLGSKTDKFSNHTRIVATYDFTRFRNIVAEIHTSGSNLSPAIKKKLIDTTSDNDDEGLSAIEITKFITEIEKDLKNGRLLDWTIISPLLRIPHNEKEYLPPTHPHGTHIAGILGACLKDNNATESLLGMCPAIELYDIRVLDGEGKGDEFNILAAIQFVRWLNSQKDGLIIHGVNLSFSMIHEVASYACGQTPVCDACEKLVSIGTIVVAAAGNLGQAMFQSISGPLEQGFRMVNITDPGNAESVITVGSTHSSRPHSYGVSYFSSKGPTGDGRIKPDLVAPGEKIVSTVIDNATDRMDGTSMAAPHVSGAAALLIAKHRELIGRPKRVKEILCKTATDLGREKYFQGCGMIDVLRALQAV